MWAVICPEADAALDQVRDERDDHENNSPEHLTSKGWCKVV
jgi:hypothetical protein